MLEFVCVILFNKMSKLVGHHIFNTIQRFLRQLEVEHDLACIFVAFAPT